MMRSYRYVEPGEDGPVVHTLTEAEILAEYKPYWEMQMAKVGKQDLISDAHCLADWITVHWAWRVPIVWNKRDPHVPADAVYVGRPTKWGNPFVIGKDGDRAEVVQKYREWVHTSRQGIVLLNDSVVELRGKDLVCWCAPEACHADVLLEIANAQTP